jgi:hypothetical protein
MKVSLCLSGQIRSQTLVRDSIKKYLIDPYDCDVFCHFWHRYDNLKYQNYYNKSDTDQYGSYSSDSVKEIVDFYKPISLKYQFPLFEQNTKSMLFSIYESNNLRTEYEKNLGIVYDVVIRSRYDILFKSQLIIEEVKDNTIYTINRPGGCGGYNEWVVYGKPNVMNVYSNIYNEYKNTQRILELCPEGMFGEYLNKLGIQVKYINRVFGVVREHGGELI